MILSPQFVHRVDCAREDFKRSVCSQVDALFSQFLRELTISPNTQLDSISHAQAMYQTTNPTPPPKPQSILPPAASQPKAIIITPQIPGGLKQGGSFTHIPKQAIILTTSSAPRLQNANSSLLPSTSQFTTNWLNTLNIPNGSLLSTSSSVVDNTSSSSKKINKQNEPIIINNIPNIKEEIIDLEDESLGENVIEPVNLTENINADMTEPLMDESNQENSQEGSFGDDEDADCECDDCIEDPLLKTEFVEGEIVQFDVSSSASTSCQKRVNKHNSQHSLLANSSYSGNSFPSTSSDASTKRRRHCHKSSGVDATGRRKSVRVTKMFKYDESLARPIQMGDGSFLCRFEGCGKLISKGNLARHERTHIGVKPFLCEQCGRNFARSDHLSEHERTQHPIGGPMSLLPENGEPNEGILSYEEGTIRIEVQPTINDNVVDDDNNPDVIPQIVSQDEPPPQTTEFANFETKPED